jgi:hypothetical protein
MFWSWKWMLFGLNLNRVMIVDLFNLFYEQYPSNSLSFSHFFAHYKSPHDPKIHFARPVLKIKLKLCITSD